MSEILGIYIYYLENNNAMEDKAMMRKETKLARSRQLTSINKNKKDGLWRARVQLSLKNSPSGDWGESACNTNLHFHCHCHHPLRIPIFYTLLHLRACLNGM